MFGQIGMGEVLVILVIVLLVFGPKKLPELARGLSRGLNEFKRAAEDVKQELRIDEHIAPPKPEKPEQITPRNENKDR